MRPLIAVILSGTILGGVWVYTGFRPQQAPISSVVSPVTSADEHYAAELTLTFSAEADPFALTVDDENRPAALLVRFNGRDLLRITDQLTAGDPVKIDPLPGTVVGPNELFFQANPPSAEGNQAHAVRVRISRDGVPFAEQTFWSEPGTRLTARYEFLIDPQTKAAAPQHQGH